MDASLPCPPPAGRRHTFGFAVAATAFTTSLAFSSVPTPLYALYARRSDLSTADVTVVFAAYPFGVLVSLYIAGNLSDHIGRKPVLIAALLIELVSACLFLGVPDMPGLLVARLLSGIGVGLTTATATAYLWELHASTRRGEEVRRPQVVAVLANLCGTGIGPVVAGVLGEFAPAPLRLVYAAFAVLLLALPVLGIGVGAAHLPLRDLVVVIAAAAALLVVVCVRTVDIRTTAVVT